MMTALASFRQAAEDNWPEDEARASAEAFLAYAQSDGIEYAKGWLVREISHWEKEFSPEEMRRWHQRFQQLTEPTP